MCTLLNLVSMTDVFRWEKSWKDFAACID